MERRRRVVFVGETLFCENCGAQPKPDANYCGKCGNAMKPDVVVQFGSAYERIAKDAIETCKRSIETSEQILFPTAEEFLKECRLILEDYKIKTSIQNKKLVLEKEAKITSADKALFRAYQRKQAKIVEAEKEFDKISDKYRARKKDDSFYAILHICEVRNTPRREIEANFDDYGLVLYFPTRKDDN